MIVKTNCETDESFHSTSQYHRQEPLYPHPLQEAVAVPIVINLAEPHPVHVVDESVQQPGHRLLAVKVLYLLELDTDLCED